MSMKGHESGAGTSFACLAILGKEKVHQEQDLHILFATLARISVSKSSFSNQLRSCSIDMLAI